MVGNDKVQILCNYGGDVVFKNRKCMYEGGITRLIFVARSIKHYDLLLKVEETCKPTVISTIKYEYPRQKSIPSLVSILNDDDVSNMMQVFPKSSTPIQLYAFPPDVLSNSISTPIADTRQEQSLQNDAAIQGAQRAVHEINETITSSSQRVDAFINIDGNQSVLSHSHDHEESSTVVNSQDLGDATLQKTLGISSGDHSMMEKERGVRLQPQISYTLTYGQEFRDGNAFDMALREYAIQSQFEYKPIKTNHTTRSAKCVREGCLWRIKASKVLGGPEFRIDHFNNEHARECSMLDCKDHPQASMNWIANFIIRHWKNFKSTPNDIAEDIYSQYGIEVGYHKARRGRELALKEQHLGDKISVFLEYCNEIERTNPGSFVTMGFSLDGSFGVFIAYNATICGFQRACRPIIVLNGRKNLKGEHPHRVWLFASGLDANNEEFLLAYAIVESSNTETWTWFCVHLASLLKDTPKLTIVIERHETPSGAVTSTFPDAHHRWRYRRGSLYREFCQRFECPHLRNLFREAIFNDTVSGCQDHLSAMSSNCPEAEQWINEISSSRMRWAVSHFDASWQDYKEGFSGSVFDIWTDDADHATDSSMVSSLKRFHAKVTEIFLHRKTEKVSQFIADSLVTPYAFSRLEVACLIQEVYEVQYVNDIPTQFYVHFAWHHATYLVNVEKRTCSCRVWELQKFPCEHAVATLHHRGYDAIEYCECYSIAKYREAYSGTIHPIVDRFQSTKESMKKMSMLNNKNKKRARKLSKK